MADKSKTGQSLPTYTYKVDRVKVKEFLEAIGDDNPLFRNRDEAISEGYSDTPVPATYITTAFQEFTGAYFKAFEELGVSLEKVFHGEEEYEYLGEIYPGDILRCSMSYESIIEKVTKSGKMDLITLRTLFTNQNDEVVLKARSLIIERK